MVLASDEILAAGKPAFQGDLPPPSPSKESLMLISLATGKRGSWQLHRGEHPAYISGGHPLSLQGRKNPFKVELTPPRTITNWASAGEAEGVTNCGRKRGWKMPMKAQRVERWEWETGL